MLDILHIINSTKDELNNNMNFITSNECEKLKLIEQINELEKAESSIRQAIKLRYQAKIENPEMFIDYIPQPLILT